MKDTLEIVQDHTIPMVGNTLVVAPTYHAKLNGVPMEVGEAVSAYVDNDENPPLNLPYLPGFRWMPRIRPQTAPESSCAYCASIMTGLRCESCGAPKRSKKDTRTPWEKWKVWEHGKDSFPECLHTEVR